MKILPYLLGSLGWEKRYSYNSMQWQTASKIKSFIKAWFDFNRKFMKV